MGIIADSKMLPQLALQEMNHVKLLKSYTDNAIPISFSPKLIIQDYT
jgi:hypothetical protein